MNIPLGLGTAWTAGDQTPTRGGPAEDGRNPDREPERIETVIIGAGQAGLATAQQLLERGRACVVLEANERVGDNWRRHYDSLLLYNPAKYCRLPGMTLPGDPDHYPTRDEVADWLEQYVDEFDLPVRVSTRVERVTPQGEGYLVSTDRGDIVASNVVAATGTFGSPYTPSLADDLDPEIVQLHSSEYKNSSQLRPGPVLVVGAAHSGADVAHELASEGREVVLAGRATGEVPFDINAPLMRVVWPILRFVATRVLTIRTPVGRKVREKMRAHGGPLIRYKRADLERVGVEWIEERVEDVTDGAPTLTEGRVIDAANVIWCTGFRQNFGWIDAPIAQDDGWPLEERGVSTVLPGLYFVGLAFQYSASSTLILGAGRDAAYVADHIDEHSDERVSASAAA
ncbi:MAG: NAD(P)-binding domain-containing protein [Nitriliruptorales bacterium]|nr:NAD(P)-binding domain-containing protein [Nitriliruptorales bacterium]